jgi:hypothetical protein
MKKKTNIFLILILPLSFVLVSTACADRNRGFSNEEVQQMIQEAVDKALRDSAPSMSTTQEHTNVAESNDPVSFLSIFTDYDVTDLLNYNRIDPNVAENKTTVIICLRSYNDTGHFKPTVYAAIGDTYMDSLDKYIGGNALVIKNQATYYFDDSNERCFIFTLLPNGNILVEEFGVEYGFNGEYEFGGSG